MHENTVVVITENLYSGSILLTLRCSYFLVLIKAACVACFVPV
jgi:hypothetical protein